MARPAIFGTKHHKARYQGILSEEGAARFEQARVRLAELVGWAIDRVSDGDVMEYMARGHAESQRWLVKQKLIAKLK